MNIPRLEYFTNFINDTLRLRVHILLADDCKNGHADFSITAQGYDKNKYGHWIESFGGCCHDEILARFPELKPFVLLHLSDVNGVPMYAVENGYFHLWDDTKTKEQREKNAMEYLRITKKEVKILSKAQDKDYFRFMIGSLNLPDRWKREAVEAIKMLEKFSGKKWNSSYIWERSNFKPLSVLETNIIAKKIIDGFYSSFQIKQREEAKRKEKIIKEVEEIELQFQKACQKEAQEAKIKIFLINQIEKLKRKDKKNTFIMDYKNAIWYSHINELCFNWQRYTAQTSVENFKIFCNSITEKEFQTILPVNIKFTLKQGDAIVESFTR
jgi:hypothetical protein